MLARTEFKTAAELDISEVERETLEVVMGMLRRGEVPWNRKIASVPGRTFNMSVWTHTINRCGTVCCIGGLCEMLSRGDAFRTGTERDEGLRQLFLPDAAWRRSPAEAADAIESYLMTGASYWPPVD